MEVENNSNSENVSPPNRVFGENVASPLKPVSNTLVLSPAGKKTIMIGIGGDVTSFKTQNTMKSMKFQTPKATKVKDSSVSVAFGSSSSSVSRPKTASKVVSHSSSSSSLAKTPNRPKTAMKPAALVSSLMSPSYDASVVSLSLSNVSSTSSISFDDPSFCSTTSDAREAAKLAKLKNTQITMFKVNVLKEKWAKEKQQKLNTYKEKREQEFKKLQEDTYQAQETRRKQLEKVKDLEEKKRENEKADLILKHEANVQLKEDLIKEKLAKRRISIFLNTSIRKKQNEKMKEIEEKKKEEEIVNLEMKRLDTLKIREKKTIDEIKRRESLHNRIESDRIAKEKEKEVMETLYYSKDRELLEIRYENWKDEQSYQEKMKEEEKNEIAFELNQWKLVKQYEENDEKAKKLQEKINLELTQQANEDIKEYQEKVKEHRRQSLAYRLNKARKDKDYEKGQKALQQLVLEEETRIANFDRQDVKNYRQKIQDARRQSLVYRAQTEVNNLLTFFPFQK
jgi:hypothetical protein